VTDLTNAIHHLADHSAWLDAAGRFAATALIYVGVVVLVWLYLAEPTLRPAIASSLGTSLALHFARRSIGRHDLMG
jgi:hypothetical protein